MKICSWCGKTHSYSAVACQYSRPMLKPWVRTTQSSAPVKEWPTFTGSIPITLQRAQNPSARVVIKRPYKVPSPKQAAFIASLLTQVPADIRDAAKLRVDSGQFNPGEMIDYLLANKTAAPVRTRPTLPTVANGRYALPTLTDQGNTVAFYQVWTSSAGFVQVQRHVGGNLVRVPWSQVPGVLERIAANPQEALRRYGKELGQCGHCGRALTNDESRRAGIGPICAAKGF